MKYNTVVASSPIELDEIVGRLMEEGWYPQGGVAVMPWDGDVDFLLIQAVVYDDEIEQIQEDIATYFASLESQSSDKH